MGALLRTSFVNENAFTEMPVSNILSKACTATHAATAPFPGNTMAVIIDFYSQ